MTEGRKHLSNWYFQLSYFIIGIHLNKFISVNDNIKRRTYEYKKIPKEGRKEGRKQGRKKTGKKKGTKEKLKRNL